jgi:hypothetical protein
MLSRTPTVDVIRWTRPARKKASKEQLTQAGIEAICSPACIGDDL